MKGGGPFGDIDSDPGANKQVPGAYQPSASKDALSGKDIDEGHGGINVIVNAKDGAASSTTMTVHNSSAPTAADMGFM